MSTTRRRPHTTTGAGVPALVAAAGLLSMGPVVPGELVWFPEPCTDPRCDCSRRFTGASSGGAILVAEVRRLPHASRADVERALAAAMRAAGHDPACARSRASMHLRIAASLEVGRLLHLADGAPRAFPAGTRVQGGRLELPITHRRSAR